MYIYGLLVLMTTWQINQIKISDKHLLAYKVEVVLCDYNV